MNQLLIGVLDASKQARDLLRNSTNLGYLVKVNVMFSVMIAILYVAFFVITAIIGAGTGLSGGDGVAALSSISLVSLIIPLLGLVVASTYGAAALMACLDIYSGQHQLIVPLYKSALKKIVKLSLVGLVSGLVIGLGYMFFVIPGIIFATMFIFADLFVLEENAGVIEALKKSASLVSGYKMNLVGKGIAMMFITLFLFVPAALILFGSMGMLASAVISTLVLLVKVVVYKSLRSIKG